MMKSLPNPVTQRCSLHVVVAVTVALGAAVRVGAANHDVDPAKSSITVHVSKAGVFRAFGDNHEVRAPIKTGSVDDGPDANVRIVIDAAQMRVLDHALSPKDRGDVQTRMLGPDVLDVAQFPEIRFESTHVRRTESGALAVEGRLTLHGRTRAVVVNVRQDHDHYRGTTTAKQSDFGITPVTVAGGTVKVKDELAIEFDIVMRG